MRGLLYGEAAAVVVFSCLIVRSAVTVDRFPRMYEELLHGKPLPAATVWILNYPAVLMGFGLMTGCGALACLFIEKVSWAFGVLSMLLLFCPLLLLAVDWVLKVPLQPRILYP